MVVSSKHLGSDEYVLHTMRTHIKALFLSIVSFLALIVLLTLGIIYLPMSWRPWSTYTTIVVFLILFIWLTLLPFLRWYTTTYTITNRRIITRRGIINKSGHDLPLRRITNVTYEMSITDRLLGCGTLSLETASEKPVTLPDVPNVERVHVEITEVLFTAEDARGSEDADPD